MTAPSLPAPLTTAPPVSARLSLLSPTLRALATDLGDRLPVHHLYATPTGSALYESLVDGDDSECAALLFHLRGVKGAALDLGSGGGRLTFPLLAAGFDVTALDNEQAMLDRLSERATQLPCRLATRLHPVLADMRAPGLVPSSYVAVVLGTTTITLLDRADRIATFRAVAELLQPDGRFLVTTIEISDPDATGADADVGRTTMGETSRILVVSVGHSRHLVTMIETVDQRAGRREVALLDCGPLGGTVSPAVHLNQPYLLRRAALVAELAEAGLAVHATDDVGVLGDRRVVLVEARRTA